MTTSTRAVSTVPPERMPRRWRSTACSTNSVRSIRPCRVRVVLQRRCADRPRDPATDRTCLDQRLQRRARTSDHPARRLDADPAGGDGRTHRPRPRRTPPARTQTARVPMRRRHCSVTSASSGTSRPAQRWGPHRARGPSLRCTRNTARCCTAVTPSASRPIPSSPRTACTPAIDRGRSSRSPNSRTAPSQTPPPLRMPGLDLDARYRIEHWVSRTETWGSARIQPGWLSDGVTLTGRQLAFHGVQPPVLHPESAMLFSLTRI